MIDRPDDEPAFLDDEGPSADIPPFITRPTFASCMTYSLVKRCQRLLPERNAR